MIRYKWRIVYLVGDERREAVVKGTQPEDALEIFRAYQQKDIQVLLIERQ